MFTVDSQILRLTQASVESTRRRQPASASLDPVAADELFAAYLDELLDDELLDEHPDEQHLGEPFEVATSKPTVHRESTSTRAEASPNVIPPAAGFQFDDVLRLAVPDGDFQPLG